MPLSQDDDRLRRAVQLQRAGDADGAFALYRTLYPRHKVDPHFLMNMAIVALSAGKVSQARTLANQVLALRGDAGSAHNLLGVLALRAGDEAGAVAHFRNFVACAPNHVDAHLNLAEALSRLDHMDEAELHLARACALTPQQPHVHYQHGACLRALGRFEAAQGALRRALALAPHYAGAWKLLAELGALDRETDLPALNAAAQNHADNNTERAKIHAAIATVYERAGDFDAAFTHFDQANHAMHATFEYDVAKDEALMQNIAEVFDPALMARLHGACSGGDAYIFILGLPRSGTTLVEQILAGYADVHTGGERPYLGEALQRHGETRRPYPACAPKWNGKDLRAMAHAYAQKIASLQPQGKMVTDKMPKNFLYVGLIRALFPKARIIHCMRNPVDTCLSNFRQIFTTGQYFSYSQEEMARYHVAYRKLMDHWHTLFQDEILDVHYEDLVENPAVQARRLVEYCGLQWDDACLNLDAERAVKTASATQVRGTIHKGYAQRWRKYEPHLKPMLNILNIHACR